MNYVHCSIKKVSYFNNDSQYLQAKVIVSVIIVVSQLFTDSLYIRRTKSITTYCSPLSITVNLHTSLIRITTSLKTYHTKKRITVSDPSGIYTKMIC